MAPSRRSSPTLALAATLCLAAAPACRRLPPTLNAPPPPDPPTEVNLDVERIRRGVPNAAAGIDSERLEGRIRAAVLREREAFHECYTRVLAGTPDAAGGVVLGFTVETSGQVIDAVGDTSVQALRPTRECMLGIVRRMRMEGISHSARVRFPFEFENPLHEITVPEVLLYPRMRHAGTESVAALVGAGSGDLSIEEARGVVGTQTAALLGCYTPLLAVRATRRAEGTARYELTVAPDGSVVDVSAGDLAEPIAATGECLARTLRGLHFRGSGRRAVITVPLTLRPQELPTPPPRAGRGR
jgi:hypothetical protein